ncbi:OsmC family protein [Pokkaliibacter sp. CJK22405]|uniref:OsmC family protein n=1 Tax=Pokkaliibacter sp. CJK22405 TaxID=3384615 RepID=UPI003984BF9F
MAIDVTWKQNCEFEVSTENQFHFSIDADNISAPCPTEVLLSALGSCSATDVVMQLCDAGAMLASLTNRVTFTRTDTPPCLYKTITLNFVISGENISTEQVDQAIRNALDKYCHVCLMLHPSIEVDYTFSLNAEAEIHEPAF